MADDDFESRRPFLKNCPINERTGDGMLIGRCWFTLTDDNRCSRHGDVSGAVEHYKLTGELTNERL